MEMCRFSDGEDDGYEKFLIPFKEYIKRMLDSKRAEEQISTDEDRLMQAKLAEEKRKRQEGQ